MEKSPRRGDAVVLAVPVGREFSRNQSLIRIVSILVKVDSDQSKVRSSPIRKTPVRIGVGFLGLLLAEFAAAAEIEPRKPQIAVSQADEQNRVVVLRPTASRVHLNDPLRLVLHIESRNERGQRSPVTRTALKTLPTLASLKITVSAPGGKEHQLAIDTSSRPEGLPETTYAPTMVLTLGEEGVEFDAWAFFQSRPLELAWKDDARLLLEKPGMYQFSVTGELREENQKLVFTVGPIKVERGAMGLPTAQELIAKARLQAAEDAGRPELKAQAKHQPQPWVIESDQGQHTVALLGADRGWTQTRYYVTYDAQGKHVATAHRSVGTCIGEGTIVETASGPVAVQHLRVGDRIWSYDVERGQRVLASVTAMRSHVAPGALRIGELVVTAEHPVFSEGNFVPAGELELEDRLLNFDLNRITIERIDRIDHPIAVYDVTVDGVHNYFAGGLLVHNKDREYWPHVDDAYYILWPTEKFLPEKLPAKE